MSKSRLILLALAVLWVLCAGTGVGMLLRYENKAGVAATPGEQWPGNLSLTRTPGQATLVMLAHPRCPCTRASINELARLMAEEQGKLQAYVLFFRPEGAPEQWAKTDLWRGAAAIPGVRVWSDEGGRTALGAFHGSTSGQTLLYDPEGRLLFRGGITEARGHEGDNAGVRAIRALLGGRGEDRSVVHQTPVFGCTLVTPSPDNGA